MKKHTTKRNLTLDRRTLAGVAAVLFVMVAAVSIYHPRSPRLTDQGRPMDSVAFPSVTVSVEVAQTPAEKRRGLSGRVSLGQRQGMLFVFNQAGPYRFWMEGMRFPLDIIWIRDQEVVDIAAGVPVPTDIPVTVTPETTATQVLEVNAGFVEQYGVHIGDPAIVSGVDDATVQ